MKIEIKDHYCKIAEHACKHNGIDLSEFIAAAIVTQARLMQLYHPDEVAEILRVKKGYNKFRNERTKNERTKHDSN